MYKTEKMAAAATATEAGRRLQWIDIPALCLLAVAIAILFVSSPHEGDFWWSDAPRHAIDGVFYYDLLRDLPILRLKQYAMDYYLQYPALTALFYPPLFPLVEAAFFAMFGVSHTTAQLTVAVLYLWAVWGAYVLSRRWLSRTLSFSVALLFAGMPEVALWGRQVMLEIPACAFLFWACHALLRYTETERPKWLYACAALLLGGIYTKQTVAFILPLFIYMMWRRQGSALLRNRNLWLSGILMVVAAIPMVAVTLRFGHVNVNSIVGGSWNTVPIFSVRGWLFYAEQLPAQIGWPTAVLAAVYVLGCMLRADWRSDAFVFMGGWFVTGYGFFSLIALKEPRHTLMILLPLAFFAISTLRHVLGRIPGSYVAIAAFAITTFGYTVHSKPVPAVAGYRHAADYIAQHAPPNSVVLFSGYRDGSFIFNMRAREDRRDLWVLRSDKLLLRVAQRRELGIEERAINEDDLIKLLNQYGVVYVVNQPNFWEDLMAMQRLQKILSSDTFEKVHTVAVTANTGHTDHRLDIYRSTKPVSSSKSLIKLELPIINAFVEGSVGGSSTDR